jgi:hypothetical protein
MGRVIQKDFVSIDMRVDSPRILLDATKPVFLIEGPSYPEDALEVYECVLTWIKSCIYNIKEQLNCEFKFNVLSSASRKLIQEILFMLEKAHRINKNIKILWYFNEDDEDMKDAGEDLMENINLPFDMICC